MKPSAKTSAFLLPLAAIILAGAGCAAQTKQQTNTPVIPATPIVSQSPSPTPTPTPTPVATPITKPTPASPAKPTIKSFSITAKRWAFEPATITVNKGDVVRLAIESVDVTHGFGLPDFNVSQNLKPGETTIVEFTADKTGTFTFFCSVFCGSGHSEMKGKLIVK